MLEELGDKNWARSSQVFSSEFCRQLALECQKKYAEGELQAAAIGRGVSKTTQTSIRGDFTQWLTEDSESLLEQDFMRSLRDISQELNAFFYLGLKRFESHFALYPPGSGYDKHVDNHRGSGARKITFILYLNESWKPGDGGELSMYDPENPESRLTQIFPVLGTFVLFRSDLFPHQVEKSFQPRLSLTGWFRDDAS